MTILENLYNQAAHVFGNVEEHRIASSEMPQAPAIHQVKHRVTKLPKTPRAPRKTKESNAVNNRDLSIEFTPEVMAQVPRQKRETKAQKKAREDLAKAAMAEQVNLIEATRTAPTHTERAEAAATALDEEKAVVPYVPPEVGGLAPYDPQPEPTPIPLAVMPYMADNVDADAVKRAISASATKRARAPRNKGGSLRALANSASFAAEVATHSPVF